MEKQKDYQMKNTINLNLVQKQNKNTTYFENHDILTRNLDFFT